MNIKTGTKASQTIDVYLKKSGSASVDEIFQGLRSSAWRNDDEVTGQFEKKTYTLKRLPAAFSYDDDKASWQAEPTDWAALSVNLKDGFTLILGGTGGSTRGREFYGFKEVPAKLRPRLIVEYTSSNQPTVAQPAYMQSGKPFLPSAKPGSLPIKYQTMALNVPSSGIWSYAPAFYKGFVYLMTLDTADTARTKYYLSWRHPLWAIAGQIEISSPGHHLLVSESGHLYIVGDKEITPYQIRPDGTPEPRTVSPDGDPTQTVTLAGNLQNAPTPTLGADGSMFYVTRDQAAYMVEGRNPDLQQLWSVTVEGPTSRVMLGPSGRYVYLTTKGEGFVTIDARTGQKFVNALPNVTPLGTNDDPHLSTPVVLEAGNGTEKVYVVKDFKNDGVLTVFSNEKTKDGDDGKIALGWKPVRALFGQPLITKVKDNDTGKDEFKLYVVRVDGSKAYVEYLDPLTGTETRSTQPFVVPKDEPYLQKGGNLAADAEGNIFVWNGQAAPPDFKGFNKSLVSRFTQEITGKLEVKSNLFFGTDGTLYAGAQQSTLSAMVPYYSLHGTTDPVTITSPTNLWVTGEGTTAAVLKGKGNTLTAPGSVILGPNFTVKEDATLTVTTK